LLKRRGLSAGSLEAIPIEDMDLIINPAQLKLIVNPNNHNIAGALVV